jgi:teichuronic acid biosynthesis glycosyltransferase TuaG
MPLRYPLPQPLVSVITPAYNSASTISIAIDSVLSQSFKQWEMIIVDDCSTDATRSLLKEYEERDNRIRVFSNPCNGGASVSRNLAIELSNGRFIAFLDSDDYWDEDKLGKQVEFMLSRRIGFSYHDYCIVDQGGKVLKKVNCYDSMTFARYLRDNRIGVLTIMLDTSIVGKPFMYDQPVAATVATWLMILKAGYCAYRAPCCLGYYRITKGSLSRNKLRSRYWYWRALRDIVHINPIAAFYYTLASSLAALKKNSSFI